MNLDRLNNQSRPAPTYIDPREDIDNFIIRRHGERPIIFQGSELAAVSSYVSGCQYWFELSLYESRDELIIVRIHKFSNCPSEREDSFAWHCSALPEVFDTIEQWDAGKTVRIEMTLINHDSCLADTVYAALSAQSKVKEARQQYKAMIGELMQDLSSAP